MKQWLSPLCLVVLTAFAATAQTGQLAGNGWSYEVLRMGNGPNISRQQAILAHNQLIDGAGNTVISTYGIGVPDYQVISELSEQFQTACEVMHANGKYRFRIPVDQFRAASRGAEQLRLSPGDVTWEVEVLQVLPPLPDVARVVAQVFKEQGADAAFRKWTDLRSQRSAEVYFGEWEVNQLGYLFMNKGHLDPALDIFQYNVQAHPDSFNAHDSMGEAYMHSGNKTLAAQHYRRSLQLNPGNQNARQVLADMEN